MEQKKSKIGELALIKETGVISRVKYSYARVDITFNLPEGLLTTDDIEKCAFKSKSELKLNTSEYDVKDDVILYVLDNDDREYTQNELLIGVDAIRELKLNNFFDKDGTQ